MRRMRKVLALFIMVCMFIPCISMVAQAASAELRFSDPSTTVGAEVQVTAKLSSSSNLKSLEAALTYDTSMLRFVSGDSATGGDGTVTISGTGSGTSMEFILTFQALAEGTAKIEVSSASGKDASGSNLTITNGSSSVTIGPGDPSLIADTSDAAAAGNGTQVEVDGTQYVITGGFTDAVIPEGFSRGTLQFEGADCEVVTQESSGISAFYLTPAAGGDADFFLYNADNGTFSPFEEVEIAQGRYLVLLRDDGSVKLPDAYQETTLTLNGKEFPAWQNTENAEYYVVYGLNSDGEKALYQYDTVDQTYQRYVANEASSDSDSKKSSPSGLWGKILGVIEDFLDIAVILTAVFVLILLVILIVVATKLRHRNLELDDLYDEYGIDLEEEEPKKQKAEKGKKKSAAVKGGPAVRTPAETAQIDLDEDDFDDFEEYDEEEFDDYGTPDPDDLDEDYGYDDDEDDSDDLIEDLDELLSEQPKKKRGHMEEDDTFKVDFIDLD